MAFFADQYCFIMNLFRHLPASEHGDIRHLDIMMVLISGKVFPYRMPGILKNCFLSAPLMR